MKNKTLVIIQARLGSSRFPEKVLKKIGNLTVIEIILKRLKKSKKINDIVVATSLNKKDLKLVNFLKKKKIKVFQGSELNVLERYYKAAKKFSANYVVRVCGDCPYTDSNLLDKMISKIQSKRFNYISNTNPPTYPDGLDLEVFTFENLKNAHKKAKSSYDKENVTPYIIRKSNKKFNFSLKKDLSKIRLTIDEHVDLKVLNNVFKKMKKSYNFSTNDLFDLIDKNKNIFKENMFIKRNVGGKMNNSQKLWRRALSLIPGGNMLLSKRPEMFLPGLWPAYFSKSKDCYIWDLDGKKYIDLATMSVGTNILGYSNKQIDSEVIKSIKKGNMSSLNCPEEVYLSEKLLKLHKGFDMIRYAKTGGEANSIAVRIARAFTKKDNIAICGYHGWHDWYLSANLSSKKNLSGHLLTGLSASGVPKKLINTVFPFEYNNIKKFYNICKKNKIGIVKMEVYRNFPPKNDFLEKVRDFCNKNKIVLIFDECTSGFRETFGGLHLKYKVIPDICILGKALGNGYPITAVLGKREIMQCAQSTFISSTFWSDRIGYVAAIKTLNEMEKIKSWEKIRDKGKYIKNKWSKLAKKNNLIFIISGLDALPSFTIKSKKWLQYKSFITYKMLENSILASNTIYVSICHTKKIIDKYFTVLDKLLKSISQFEKNKNIEELNKIPICHDGFKRLN
jgi:glutamate-1-semialdehyde 2,1-aminomutase